MTDTKLCWLDIRQAGSQAGAVVAEAVHQRVDGIVAADPAVFDGLAPTVRRILLFEDGGCPDDLGAADLVILPDTAAPHAAEGHPGVEFGRFVEIVDAASLDSACAAAHRGSPTLLSFRDPTKIPLEIVIAATRGAGGTIVTTAADTSEAEVVFGCLEQGADGVLAPARAVGDATALKRAAVAQTGWLPLVELEVTATTAVGMGERACVDTCSYLGKDEGILVGSYSKGMVLCASETHPLPYMPIRPFRVNAGAIHSYTVSRHGRTNYLSELTTGSSLLAVAVTGRTRPVSVGRSKIETRPLVAVDATGPNDQRVNLVLQNDWHVRVLGPGGAVLNSTELEPGDTVLGHLPESDRHVGYPIDEFCVEQ